MPGSAPKGRGTQVAMPPSCCPCSVAAALASASEATAGQHLAPPPWLLPSRLPHTHDCEVEANSWLEGAACEAAQMAVLLGGRRQPQPTPRDTHLLTSLVRGMGVTWDCDAELDGTRLAAACALVPEGSRVHTISACGVCSTATQAHLHAALRRTAHCVGGAS